MDMAVYLSVLLGSPNLQKSVLLSLAQGLLGAKERSLGGHPLHYGDYIPSVFSLILHLLSFFFVPVCRLYPTQTKGVAASLPRVEPIWPSSLCNGFFSFNLSSYSCF